MLEFLTAVQEFPFLRLALLTGLLTSVACGVVGSYVVTRRITYIAGAMAHICLGGIGFAKYLNVSCGWTAVRPVHGAVVSALLAAGIIGIVSLRAKEREDTIIGALWAIGMATGILFIAKTEGYNEDLMSWLFGNILMTSEGDLALLAGLDLLIVAVSVIFHNQLLAVCFDQEYARLRGVPVEAFYMLLLGLTALTVVVLSTIVGVVMVIALITLPAAVAGQFAKRLWHMMALATALCATFTTLGLAVSYEPDLPPGATIIVLAGAAYLLVMVGRGILSRLRKPRAKGGQA